MKQALFLLLLAGLSLAALPDLYEQNKQGAEAQINASYSSLKYAFPLVVEINLTDEDTYLLTVKDDGSTSLKQGMNIDANIRVRTSSAALEAVLAERDLSLMQDTDAFLMRANGVKGKIIKNYLMQTHGLIIREFPPEDRGTIGNLTFKVSDAFSSGVSLFAGLFF